MKLEHEFIQLPHSFDVKQLQKEVEGLNPDLWTAHHEGFKGNYSIPLVSRNGLKNNDFKGPMGCTDILQQCLYLRQVIASFGEIIGRSRLMGLEAGCQVPVHSDINYHWYKRVRIHIPIVTDPSVVFHCGDKQLHMQSGEAWIFDSWKYHSVKNDSDVFRVHLVIDICGSPVFWKMAKEGAVPWLSGREKVKAPIFIEYDSFKVAPINTEQFNTPLVMSPGEMEGLANDLIQDVSDVAENKLDDVNEMATKVREFCQQWRCLWSLYGFTEQGWAHYHKLRQLAFESVRHLDSKLKLNNGTQAPRMFLHCIIDPALNVEVKDSFLALSEQASRKPPKGMDKAEQALTEVDRKLISRNDPCHCGSTLKFKSCHGKLS